MTPTNNKLTLRNKEKFIHQHYGQNVLRVVRMEEPNVVKGYIVGDDFPTLNTSIRERYVELKPLLSITSEHAIEITRLLGKSKKDVPDKYAIDFVRGFLADTSNMPFEVADYLRTNGFALDLNGITVEEMVEAGWIKLISE